MTKKKTTSTAKTEAVDLISKETPADSILITIAAGPEQRKTPRAFVAAVQAALPDGCKVQATVEQDGSTSYLRLG